MVFGNSRDTLADNRLHCLCENLGNLHVCFCRDLLDWSYRSRRRGHNGLNGFNGNRREGLHRCRLCRDGRGSDGFELRGRRFGDNGCSLYRTRGLFCDRLFGSCFFRRRWLFWLDLTGKSLSMGLAANAIGLRVFNR